MTSHLYNVGFQLHLSAGGAMHDSEERSHVIIALQRRHQLLHECERLLSEQLQRNHVVDSSSAATRAKHV